MSVKEMVKLLKEQGYDVEFYVRKDGGILIKKINGQKFTGAKGNINARAILGQTLSKARAIQLSDATKSKKLLKSAPLELKDEWKRVREIWRKAFPRIKGKKNPVGTLPWKRVDWIAKNLGFKEAFQSLHEAERYATGFAYTKNIEYLASYILNAGTKLNSQELIKLSQDILKKSWSIREEWIQPCYEVLYELNKGKSPKQIANKVRRILRLL